MTIRQLSVFVENKTGRINEVIQILGANNVNMTAFSLAETDGFGILRLIVSDVELAVRVLKEAHFGVNVTNVICLRCANVPGAMSKVLNQLAKEQIFIEYMYAFADGETANVIIRPTDVDRCIDVLVRYDFDILNGDELSQI